MEKINELINELHERLQDKLKKGELKDPHYFGFAQKLQIFRGVTRLDPAAKIPGVNPKRKIEEPKPEPKKAEAVPLEERNIAQLRAMAKGKIRGYASFKKEDLIAELRKLDK